MKFAVYIVLMKKLLGIGACAKGPFRILIVFAVGGFPSVLVGEAAQAESSDFYMTNTIILSSSGKSIAEEGRVYELPSRPALRDSKPIHLAQQRTIEERLPQQTREDRPADIQLPPKPALREGDDLAFVLTAVQFTGVTVFSPAEFAPLYDHLLARAVTLDDITKLVDAVTDVYRRNGYFLSRAMAPAQNTEGGLLRIHVSEGVIADIEIKGDASSRVRRMLSSLKGETPVKLKTMERTLTLIGDLNGVNVASSKLRADPDDLINHTLVVELETDRVQASLYTDNRGTDEAGPIQAYARIAGNSLLTSGDQLSGGVFFIPDQTRELVLAEVEYQFPVGDAGTYLSASGSLSKFDAGAFLATLGTESRQKSIAVSFMHPFIRQRQMSLWGSVGFEGRDIEEEQLGVPMFEDKLRIVYGSLNFRDSRANGLTVLSGKVTSGLNMLGASNGGGSLSRPDADGQFTKFNLYASRYQNIGRHSVSMRRFQAKRL